MTDPDYDENLDPEDESSDERTVSLNRTQIRTLEKDAKRARKADEELATLRREFAFVKAGIDPEDPKLKYFAKGYDGEITAEAIRAAATEAGYLTSDDTEEAAAHERISQASAGAATQPKVDKVQELLDADRAGGKEAVLAKIREHGNNIV